MQIENRQKEGATALTTKQTKKPIQVFVRVPHQNRTLPMTLTGSESKSELDQLIRHLTMIPDTICKNMALVSQGVNIATVKQLRESMTIEVTTQGLLGGSKAPFGQVKGSDLAPDPPISYQFTSADATIGDMIEGFESAYPKDKTSEYSFIYHYNDQILWSHKDLTVTKQTQIDTLKAMKFSANQDDNPFPARIDGLNKDTMITVAVLKDGLGQNGDDEAKKKKKAEAEEIAETDGQKFLKLIPGFETSDSQLKLIGKMETQQMSLLTKFARQKMDQEDLEQIFSVLTDNQMDKMMTQLQFSHQTQLLTYLLKKADQWTSMSEVMMGKASSETKNLQIQRLLSKQENTLDPDDENDKVIFEILSEEQQQERVLGPIMQEISSVQRIELLMVWLKSNQRVEVIRALNPGQVRIFWNFLPRVRKLQIFHCLSGEEQFRMISRDKFLSVEQRRCLWDNMNKENRVNIWLSTLDEEICNNMIKKSKKLAKSRNSSILTNKSTNGNEMSMQQKSDKLKKKLLATLTMLQEANLWSILPRQEQYSLVKIILEDVSKGVAFFKELPHTKRIAFIDQLTEDNLKDMFKIMGLEDRAQLLYIMNMEQQQILKAVISSQELQELFYHAHFAIAEETNTAQAEYLEKQINEFYSTNNQIQPLDLTPGLTRQVISDPNKKNGYIAVQIWEPKFTVDNTIYEHKDDPTDRELYTDESKTFQAEKEVRNDTFRVTQNYYGELKEVEPNACRSKDKVKRGAIISFYEQNDELQSMFCTHSFFAEDPLIHGVGSDSVCSQLNILYTGLNGDVFFFNKVDTTIQMDLQCKDLKETFDLCLQVLNKEQSPNKGETSRSTIENCHTFVIDPKSALYDSFNGRFEMFMYSKVFLPNSLHTMIDEGSNKYVAFSHCRKSLEPGVGKDSGPVLFFYDIAKQKEVMKINGGEALIDYKYNKESQGQFSDRLTFLGNKEVMSMKDCFKNPITDQDSEFYCDSTVTERKSAIVISMNCRLSQEFEYDVWPVDGDEGCLIKRPNSMKQSSDSTKNSISNSDMGAWIPSDSDCTIVDRHNRNISLSVIDMKDEDHVFQQRYLRNTLMQVEPHRNENGDTESFTILYRQIYAFTFQFIQVIGKMDHQTKKHCQEQFDEMNKEIKEMKQKDKLGEKREEIKAQKAIRDAIFENAIPKHNMYRCKYVVPDASEIIFDRREAKVQTYVQVSNRNEEALLRFKENPNDKNDFELKFYNISNTYLRQGEEESLPDQQVIHKVPMNYDALKIYAKNVAPNKFGHYKLLCVAFPATFGKMGVIGGFIMQSQQEIKAYSINWFIKPAVPKPGYGDRVCDMNCNNKIFDYPMLAYRSFIPDGREIILANLADKTQPQKVIHLYDLQFMCFVGHNQASKDSRIGMLCLKDQQFKLVWLVQQQPFKKRAMNELDHIKIVTVDIKFRAPISNQLTDIVSCEFVNEPIKSFSQNGEVGSEQSRGLVNQSEEGALLIQTKTNLWFSSNSTGYYEPIHYDAMSEVKMVRGFNSYFYFAARSNETDAVIYELKLTMQGKLWSANTLEVLKMNESRVIALELDHESRERSESIYQYNRILREEQPDITNVMFIIDDKDNMWKMRQKTDDESGSRYEILSQTNLSAIKGMSRVLKEQDRYTQFGSLSITDRCLTTKNSHYSFVNGTKWAVNTDRGTKVQKIGEKNHTKSDRKLIKSFENLTKMRVNGISEKKSFELVFDTNPVNFTSRISFDTNHVWWDPIKQEYDNCYNVVTKMIPSTRRQDLIGLRGIRDLVDINRVSNDKFLMRFQGDHRLKLNDYWTMIDRHGQIKNLPAKIKNELIWSNSSSGESRPQGRGNTIVLCGGQEKVLSIESDVAYTEKNVTQIDFNRSGEVIQVKNFEKDLYEPSLKKAIVSQLLSDSDRLFGQNVSIDKEKAQEISEGLEQSSNVLITAQGDLYRVASIIHPQFTDQVAINPFNDVDNDDIIDSDDLTMGIFVVNPKKKRESLNLSKMSVDNKDLKIILFMCKSKRDREYLNNAGFVIVGKYLCWSFPKESVVHVLDMEGMNKKESSNFFIKSAGKLAENFTKFPQFMPISESESKSEKKPQQMQSSIFPNDDSYKRVRSPQKLKINDSDDDDDFKAASDEPIVEKNYRSLSIESQPDFEKSDVQKSVLMISKTQSVSMNDINTEIQWEHYETRVINLNIMCETEADRVSMSLLELPKNLAFSVIKADDQECNYEELKQPEIRENLLQVTVRDRILVLDLAKPIPQEIFFMNASSQFIDPMESLDAGVKLVYCREDPTAVKDGFLVDQVSKNNRGDLNVLHQTRKVFDQSVVLDDKCPLPRTPILRGIFNNFAEQDLQELNRIYQTLKEKKKLDNIDMQTLLSSYKDGHTAFSIFYDNIPFFEQVLVQMQEGEFENEVDEEENELENRVLRRLYRVLNKPVPQMVEKKEKDLEKLETSGSETDISLTTQDGEENLESQNLIEKDDKVEVTQKDKEDEAESKTGLYSVLQKSLYHNKPRIKDCLLYITNKCGECQISSFCENQDDFATITKSLNESALELISDSFVSNIFTSRIMNTKWSPDVEMVTFQSTASLITPEQLNDQVMNHRNFKGLGDDEIQKMQVNVQILDISWMLRDRKNFVLFTGTLDEADESIYETEFIKVLLEQFWADNSWLIIIKGFIPWCVYAICAMGYFVSELNPERPNNQIMIKILAAIVFLTLTWQIGIEVRQLRQKSAVGEYFTNLGNLMDVFQVSTTVFIVTMKLLDIDFPTIETQRVIAALSTFCLWVKVLDWLKLFRNTSFFIKLIADTLVDIKPFTIIFFVALFMFGMPMYMLQLNRDDENAVVEETFGKNWILNAWYNQYMLALGAFTIDGFGDGPQTYLCYAFFLIATFLTQVTFLNMLIAIMGDSYGKVMEAQDKYALLTQREILSDYTALIVNNKAPQDERRFLFVVTPKTEDEDNGAWEGSLAMIKKTVDGGLSKLKKHLDKKFSQVTSTISDAKARDTRIEKEGRGQYLRMSEKFQSLEKQIETIDSDKTGKIYDIVNKSRSDQQNEARVLKDTNEVIHEQQAKLLKQSQETIDEAKADDSNQLMKELQELKESLQAVKPVDESQQQAIENQAQQKSQSEALIKTMAEQQTQLLQEVKEMKGQNDQLSQSLGQNTAVQQDQSRALSQLQNDQEASKASLAQELSSLNYQVQQIKETVSQQQQPSAGIDMAALQGFVQQMAAQQQQMQQVISDQMRADKEEILELIQENDSQTNEF